MLFICSWNGKSKAYYLLTRHLIPPGARVAEKPPLREIHQTRKLESQEKWIPSSRPVYTTQLDTAVPIVNPSPPSGTITPIVNPNTSPPSPTATDPTLNPPPTPTMTTPTPTMTNPTPTTNNPGSSGGQWCIANPSASPTALQVALDYACGYGGADCSQIQPGASCYNPNTVKDHASFAFNDYYHKNPAPTSCVFGGTAQLTSTDPSKISSLRT